jgi:hypothetical protein
LRTKTLGNPGIEGDEPIRTDTIQSLAVFWFVLGRILRRT